MDGGAGACMGSRGLSAAGVALAGCLTAGSAMAQEAAPVSIRAVTLDSRHYLNLWDGNRGTHPTVPNKGSGSQLYSTTSVRVDGRIGEAFKFDFTAKGGAVRSEQTTRGTSGLYSGLVDAQTRSKLTFIGAGALQPFLALQTNIPVGTSALGRGQRFARMDADLVEVSSFGQGWNWNPSAGLTAAVTDAFYLSGSVGKVWRGAYRRDRGTEANTGPAGPQVFNRFDPSDPTSITGTALWEPGILSLTGAATYAWEDEALQDGTPLYRKGERITLHGSADAKWSEAWTTSASATWSRATKNKYRSVPGPVPLELEDFNSNGDIVILGLDQVWRGGAWTVTGSLGFTRRFENDHDYGLALFTPAKDKVSAGLAASYAWSPSTTLHAGITGFATDEASPEPAAPAVDQRGLQVLVGMTWKP